MPTLKDVLEGRRKWLETFANDAFQDVAEKTARGIVDQFQGMDEAAIFERMKDDYLQFLYRTLNLRDKSGNPSSLMPKIDYLIQQLTILEAWKSAGFPASPSA